VVTAALLVVGGLLSFAGIRNVRSPQDAEKV
jgi:hypothetical protein